MSGKRNYVITLTGLFAAYVFLQFTVLGLGNHAGEGWLSTGRRELVYYALQVFVIPGFLAYAAAGRFLRGERNRRRAAVFVFAALFAGTAVMLFAEKGSLFYLTVTLAVMPCLGCIAGAVYHRMSRETAAGENTARSMGIGSAVAVALQFVLQIRWGVTPVLAVFMLAALVLVAYVLLRVPPRSEGGTAEPAPPRRILFACLIAAAFLLFGCFYNGYLHHLQIQSGYTDYNLYSWPRLMMIPCYLLFAAIGDQRRGALVPVAALCISLVSMLNAALIGSAGAYWLNMCLFYCALAAFVSYYNLTFWRLAQGTKRPALWASMGRILDSAMVLLTWALHISELPGEAMLAVNIAGLAAIILLMATGGDFNLAVPAVPEPAPQMLSAEAALDRMRERYALTPRETDVLRELVLTEDKQAVISERLSIQIKALQKYVTQLYRKTGAKTRSGLTDLYHNTMIGH